MVPTSAWLMLLVENALTEKAAHVVVVVVVVDVAVAVAFVPLRHRSVAALQQHPPKIQMIQMEDLPWCWLKFVLFLALRGASIVVHLARE